MPKPIVLSPISALSQLSQFEMDILESTTNSELYSIFRDCSLAVLLSGEDLDDAQALLSRHAQFKINLLRSSRGIKLELVNPPNNAFVDGEILHGTHELLFYVLRDILFASSLKRARSTLAQSAKTTDWVFSILRHAEVLPDNYPPKLAVCWGGHSINNEEYKYSKDVGYQLGLRGMDICTGCGPGIMKGPMKGAAISHAKQHNKHGRYLGLTEPSIIAAEPPNQIVNELVILPDIEKRLEAFVRVAHTMVIFPGGAGTIEELLYLLGLKLHPNNQQQPLPLILTGPLSAKPYFDAVETFLTSIFGEAITKQYQVVLGDAKLVAQMIKHHMQQVKAFRKQTGDAYQFNWKLHIPRELQEPFEPSHQSMRALDLQSDKVDVLCCELRKLFSGIVAGNVKAKAIEQIKNSGPFIIKGEKKMMSQIDKLLALMVAQGRMKLPGSTYHPCYKIEHQ